MDISVERIGQSLENLIIEPLADLEQRIREKNVEIGIVTVPAESAQEVADTMVGAGVRSC